MEGTGLGGLDTGEKRTYNRFMGLIEKLKDWFAQMFSRDPEEGRRRAEIRKLQLFLTDRRPPYYRIKQNLVLPGFALGIYRFYSLMRPFAELVRATVANSDIKISQRFFDYLIDCRLPLAAQEQKRFFSYEGMSERVMSSLKPEEELEAIRAEFEAFLGALNSLGAYAVDNDLFIVDRFIDLCRHDYERIIGLFDPSANLDDPRYKPDFAPVSGEQLLPELVDFYYLSESFVFSPQIKENVCRLFEKRRPGGFDASQRNKVDKLLSQMDKELSERLGKDVLLALMRVIKHDPVYTPSTPRQRREFLDSYRRRLITQFEKDRERILREQNESAIATDIRSLFGEDEILEVEGYDDEQDSILRQESPNGFAWIKPLRILKTYISYHFEPQLKEAVKRVLVEGYFDNKGFQNNLANILYQCERSLGRITEFEEQLRGTGRVSLVAMKRYIEEMRRGKDISTFLNRLVDAINGKAQSIVEDESGLFAMLDESLATLVLDYKRSSPDLITNIRALGGGRNREIMALIQAGRERISILVKIMKNFTYVKRSPSAGYSEPAQPSAQGAPASAAPLSQGEPPADSQKLEPLDDITSPGSN
jgi:hypothetical protein